MKQYRRQVLENKFHKHNTTFSDSISKIKVYKSVVRAKITVDLKYYRHDEKLGRSLRLQSLQLRPYIRIHIRVYAQAGLLPPFDSDINIPLQSC